MSWTPSLANPSQYKVYPQVPVPSLRYMESWPDTVQIYSTSTSMSIIPAYPLTSLSTRALCRCFKILPIDASGILCKHCRWHRNFCAGHRFRLNSTHSFRLYLNRFSSIQVDSQYLFIFDWSHTIRVPFQSIWRDSHICRSVLQIIQQ